MKIRKIKIAANNTEKSNIAKVNVLKAIDEYGFILSDENPDLVIAIGGDGAFIKALQDNNFNNSCFYIGIHTGHLGFLQEIDNSEINDFFDILSKENYRVEEISVEKIKVYCNKEVFEYNALNEVVIRNGSLKTMFMEVEIDGHIFESFAGDGLTISTPTGSTAYNLSLGGSIVYPGLSVLQVIPIAPIDSEAYRSLRNGVLVPENSIVELKPINDSKNNVFLVVDGILKEFEEVDKLEIVTSKDKIKLIRFDHYNFWTRVKAKFLH
jgi:NAD+ kinase